MSGAYVRWLSQTIRHASEHAGLGMDHFRASFTTQFKFFCERDWKLKQMLCSSSRSSASSRLFSCSSA